MRVRRDGEIGIGTNQVEVGWRELPLQPT